MIPRIDSFTKLKKNISDEKKILKELSSAYNELSKPIDANEKRMISDQVTSLKNSFEKNNNNLKEILEKTSMIKKLEGGLNFKEINKKPLQKTPLERVKPIRIKKGLSSLDKETLKRLGKKEKKVVHKKEKKARAYVGLANRLFSKTSGNLLEKGGFKGLRNDLVKANMHFLAKSYISMILLNTILSIIFAIFIFIFFLFFNFGSIFPFITQVKGDLLVRLGKVFWILILIPLGTFLLTYLYPSFEKKAIEGRINHELPFATIHMAAISESMIEPSNIFRIIVTTKEYPWIEREFIKLLNEINLFGHDLITALRNSAFNTPSRKLSELFDGVATTITSGGDLSDFFDKRSQTLLFDYKLDQEKQTKTSETFMDIYISVVIAAPMILMLLLIMMKVSGLGISLSTPMISFIMVLGVSIINVIFIGFLQLRKT